MSSVILSLIPDKHRKSVFRDETWAGIKRDFEVIQPENDDEAMALLSSASGVITGWGTTFVFTPKALCRATNLRIIAHAAGSVKFLFPDPRAREIVTRREIVVFSGVEAMAVNVAESTVGLLILAMRRWPEHAAALAGGHAWRSARPSINGQFLTRATVGLVGLSTVARKTIPLLKPFGCRLLAYDPHVSAEAAARLGVELVELNDLFRRSDAVSLHAPALPSTRRMIGAEQLRLLRDGAMLLNTARGMILDHEALYAECKTGRIGAVLDVTDPEPLPASSPLIGLSNVFILPHIAAQGHAGLYMIGDMAFEALALALDGADVSGAVAMDRWEVIA